MGVGATAADRCVRPPRSASATVRGSTTCRPSPITSSRRRTIQSTAAAVAVALLGARPTGGPHSRASSTGVTPAGASESTSTTSPGGSVGAAGARPGGVRAEQLGQARGGVQAVLVVEHERELRRPGASAESTSTTAVGGVGDRRAQVGARVRARRPPRAPAARPRRPTASARSRLPRLVARTPRDAIVVGDGSGKVRAAAQQRDEVVVGARAQEPGEGGHPSHDTWGGGGRVTSQGLLTQTRPAIDDEVETRVPLSDELLAEPATATPPPSCRRSRPCATRCTASPRSASTCRSRSASCSTRSRTSTSR